MMSYIYVYYISDIVKENENDIEFHAVFQRLSEEEIPDLPPGGGLYSKYVIICQNISSSISSKCIISSYFCRHDNHFLSENYA